MLVHSLYVQYRAEVKKIYSASEKSRLVSAHVLWLKCPPLTNCCSISARFNKMKFHRAEKIASLPANCGPLKLQVLQQPKNTLHQRRPDGTA